MTSSKELLGAAALVLTFVAFYPYVRSILRDETRPHVFSWMIWGAGTFVVALAQFSGGAGVGAWTIAVSGIITVLIAALALYKAADARFRRSDWMFLILAMSALPLWYYTDSPLSAVIILTAVDLLGFGPSISKAYKDPYGENALFFVLGALRNGLVIGALQYYSWTTALFPAAVGAACLLFAGLILLRRMALARSVVP
ncbi:MAG: hypothetical protein B7X53_16565 [Hyphomonas sp. 34-62-18]|nr:hypothetical protein [Hyphomonas sp. 34-62-18]OZB13225.1 MAG: hypothetical protein B7X53_16565 [Hyphomonas sp. 34-62-18]